MGDDADGDGGSSGEKQAGLGEYCARPRRGGKTGVRVLGGRRTERPGNLMVRGAHLWCGKRCRCGDVRDRRVVSREHSEGNSTTNQSIAAPAHLRRCLIMHLRPKDIC